jgi:hypothetical protein
MPTDRMNILQLAIDITAGERRIDYGDPIEVHERIAMIWSGIMGRCVEPREVALCMAAVKMVRASASPQKLDHYIDGAAYIAIAGEIESAGAD